MLALLLILNLVLLVRTFTLPTVEQIRKQLIEEESDHIKREAERRVLGELGIKLEL